MNLYLSSLLLTLVVLTGFSAEASFYENVNRSVEAAPSSVGAEAVRKFPAEYAKDSQAADKDLIVAMYGDGKLANRMLEYIEKYEKSLKFSDLGPEDFVSTLKKGTQFRDEMRALFPGLPYWRASQENMIKPASVAGRFIDVAQEARVLNKLSDVKRLLESSDPTERRKAWLWLLSVKVRDGKVLNIQDEEMLTRVDADQGMTSRTLMFLQAITGGNSVALKTNTGHIYIHAKDERAIDQNGSREIVVHEITNDVKCLALTISKHIFIKE